MVFEVPCNPNHSMILATVFITVGKTRTEELTERLFFAHTDF